MKRQSATLFFTFFLCCRLLDPVTMASSAQFSEASHALSSTMESLELPQVLLRVFEKNPELNISELEIEAASARILQAGLRPNPELSALGENIAAMGGTGLFRHTESTFQLSQRLEIGGKRATRIDAGQKERAVAGRSLELKKAELIAVTSQAFAEVLAGQERLANQRELTQLARQVHAIVVERVSAGKVSPVEQTRALVALSSAQMEEEKQQRSLVAAKDRLAAFWGGTREDFDRVLARFEIPAAPSGLADPCVGNTPDLKLAEATLDWRRSVLARELAARKPDLTISAGFRHLNLESENAWVAGASLPLPIFDKRQGAIAEARINVNKSLAEKTAMEWRMRASLSQARGDHEIALLEVRSLIQTALPAARQAMAAIEEGYRFGKFDFLNVLDAQKTYAELRRRYIEAVASGLKAAIEIERLARCDSPATPTHPSRESKEATREK